MLEKSDPFSFIRKISGKVLLNAFLLVAVLVIFFRFTDKNSDRILLQNENYIKSATVQTSRRLNDMFTNAKNSIETIAYLYSQNLDSPQSGHRNLKILTGSGLGMFDAVEFADRNGISRDSGGKTTPVAGRRYFREGMQGKAGMDVVFDSPVNHENLVVFYAPVRYGSEIVGVLHGHFRERLMTEIMTATFFGVEARSFLVGPDGRIVASSAKGFGSESIFDIFQGPERYLDEPVARRFADAFEKGQSFSFLYNRHKGVGSAYMDGLKDYDLAVLQTFPEEAMTLMIANANRAGVGMETELIAVFAVYGLLMLLMYYRQRRKLMAENREMGYVIGGITQLFDRFVLVDFEKDRYQYLAGTGPQAGGIPVEGDYSVLKAFMVSAITDEDDRAHMGEALEKASIQRQMKGNRSDLRFEYRAGRGESVWDMLNVICLKRIDGVPVLLLFTRQDVTETKAEQLRNHIALKEAFLAAENASRAKSDFLSNMSHDIRTPMNAIMGMTAIAAMHVNEPAYIQDCLGKITLSSRHLLKLINDILDMSRIESGKVFLVEETFVLPTMVEALLAISLPQIRAKNQQLKVQIANIVHEEVVGDPLRLQQVCINIMGNAVKFTPEGGHIALQITEKPCSLHGFGCYEFVFGDDGIGMEKEFLDRIFEPFVRADNSRVRKAEGTGLGMSIARNIVRMMNGDIEVWSEPGKGSRFTVTVHLKLGRIDEEDLTGLAQLAVLVVDDDRLACENACAILNDIGMVSDWVTSGDEAIAKLVEARRAAQEYSAVILDWIMPGKDGVATAREIRRKIGGAIPIIILSAYDWADVEQEAREAGVNAFISKPLFKSRLVTVLKHLILDEKANDIPDHGLLREKDYTGKRILLVEDNELNMEIAEELIGSTGASVEKAFNGKEAVDRLLETPPGYYGMVLMDIQMPDMNGYEATEAIRASGRADLGTLPIVAMSADAFAEDVQRALKSGMSDHFAKPVDIVKLLAVLEKWMREKDRVA
ncbi:hybrid sensor histidine kinase/response regulator [Oxalobacter paraformigenes]|uniref:histidine kinase n=1 Tax=Oxalobacter paraformigenes TaxID=556268 RepID=C3X3U2_9BURK|nr:hybrid sensor histidine kinase/response regulator [Oxalobacter paraformigenes]EEO27878.1 hypothetical protein OFAG_01031 [Oxalobacter paraformigenes]